MQAALAWLIVFSAAPPELGRSDTRDAAALKAAERKFDDLKFKAVVDILGRIGAPPLNASVRQRVWLLLGLSHFMLHHEREAQQAITQLLRENPDFTVDRDLFSPPLVAVVEQMKRRLSMEATPGEPASAPAPGIDATGTSSEPKSIVAAPADAVTPASVPAGREEAPGSTADATTAAGRDPPARVTDAHVWLRLFPLGVGHFLNRDFGAGSAFLAVETALLATHITATVMKNAARRPSGLYRAGSHAFEWQVVQNATAGALIGAIALELLDAFLWSPGRSRAPVNVGIVLGDGVELRATVRY